MGFLANPILEKVGSLHDQMGNFSKDGNSNNQMEILEIKNMVIQLKISFVWLISSFETKEERISELEDNSMDIL